MTMRLPEFNLPTDQAEWDRHMQRFKDEMIRCTRRNDSAIIPSNLNILWFSANPQDLEQCKARDDIEAFLKVSGYDVEYTRMSERLEADLLFACTDRDKDDDVSYLIRAVSGGFFGLTPGNEMLVSAPGHSGASPYKGLNLPMLLGPDFATYGMCMIHEHIKTLHDVGAKVGRHVTMMLSLEGILQDAHQDSVDKVAYKKIEDFRRLLESRGHSDGEARWVLATLDLLRCARNMQAHMPTPKRAENCYATDVYKINDLAAEFDRDYLAWPPESSISDSYSRQKKWLTQLTQITANWIVEYLKTNPVVASSSHTT